MTQMMAIDLEPLFDGAELDGAAEKFRGQMAEASSQLRDIPVPMLGEKMADAIMGEVGSIDTMQLFANGWAKLKEIRDHADPKKHRQDRTTFVRLGEHKIEGKFEPAATLSFAGIKSPRIVFGLTLTAELKAVELGIRMAHIRHVGGGEAKIKVRLDYKGEELWKSDLKKFDLPMKHRFDMPGIPLTWDDIKASAAI
jgi:hypothetical protein